MSQREQGGRAAERPASRSIRALLGTLIVLLIMVRLADVQPPRALPPDAPQDAFSAARAMPHIEALARAPRPAGTSEHAAARAYIEERLTALGIPYEVHRSSVVNRYWGLPYDVARVQNVVARIPATASGGAVALIAHYDSVPFSPGAADDASGVAALLETARALRHGAPLRNDVMLLFTDAEEGGAMGAQAFRREHPWFKEIRVALNFDARGSGGAVVMFESSPENGALIDALADAAPHAVATSLFYEVARRLGHSTDLRPFREAGVPSMNFAFSDVTTSYHTPRDRIDVLDTASVQHMGSYALALARHFGSMPLPLQTRGNVVFFDMGAGHLVSYPSVLAIPFAVVVVAAFFIVARRACRDGRARPANIGWGALGFAGAVVAGALAAAGVIAVLERTAVTFRVARGDPYDADWYRTSLTFFSAAAALLVWSELRRKLTAWDTALGALGVWAVLAAATSVAAPGASYFFVWPLAGALAGLVFWAWGERMQRPGGTAAGLLLGALPAFCLAVPGPYMFYVGLQIHRGAIAAGCAALVIGCWLAHVEVVAGGRSRWPAAVLGALGAVALIGGLSRPGFSRERPRPGSLSYALDRPTGQAVWLTLDKLPPEQWADKLTGAALAFPAFNPYDADLLTRQGQAEAIDLPAPAFAKIADEGAEGVRRVTVRVRSARAAPEMFVFVRAESAIRSVVVDGQRIEEDPPYASTPERPWGIHFIAVPEEGVALSIETNGPAALELRAIDRTYELPPVLGPYKLDGTMQVPFYAAGSTFVSDIARF